MRQTLAPSDRPAPPAPIGLYCSPPISHSEAASLPPSCASRRWSELRSPAARHGVPGPSAEAGHGGAGGGGRDGLGTVGVVLGGGAVPGPRGAYAWPPHGAASSGGGGGDRLGGRGGAGAGGVARRPASARGAARRGGRGLGGGGEPGRRARALVAAAPAGREPGAAGPRRGGRRERRVPSSGPRRGRPGGEAGGRPGGGAGGRPQRAPGARGPQRTGRAPGHRGWLSSAAGHPRCAGHRTRARPGAASLALCVRVCVCVCVSPEHLIAASRAWLCPCATVTTPPRSCWDSRADLDPVDSALVSLLGPHHPCPLSL